MSYLNCSKVTDQQKTSLSENVFLDEEHLVISMNMEVQKRTGDTPEILRYIRRVSTYRWFY